MARAFPGWVATLGGALALASCASHAPRPAPVDAVDAGAGWLPLEQMSSWRMTGKLGWRVGGKGGGSRVDWHQISPTVYRIRLTGPLGQGALLTGDSQSAKLRLGSRVSVYRGGPTKLLRKHLGIEGLPVSRLWSWLRCVPADGVPYDDGDRVLDGGGAMRQFAQDGWRLRCEKHRPTDGFLLPGRVTATRGETQFRFVTQRWLPNAPGGAGNR